MALTKVSGGILDPGINVAGIVTATGFDGPFIGGSDGINAGVGTFTGLDVNGNGDISGNLVVGGNLTANGDFTTLNTTLREVELLRVDANSSVAAGIITQTGAGDLLRLYDGTSQVVTVDDTGKVGLGTDVPSQKLHIEHNSFHQILLKRVGSGPSEAIFANAGNYTDIKNNASGVKFSVGSTPESKMVVRPVGVGIGTLIPRGDFHIEDNNPTLVFSESNAAVDNKYWRTTVNGQTWTWEGLNDSQTSGDDKFRMTRSGNDITAFEGRVSGSTWFNVSNSTQRVGIGSAIPGVLLDVQGHAGSGAQHTIRSKSTAANASNFVRSESSDDKYIGLLKYGTGHSAYGALPAGGGAVYANSSVPITIMSDGGYINFATGGNTERVRITSDGFVGIGVTNPEDYSSGGKNLVVGSSGQEGITIRSSSPNTGNLLFNDGLNLIAGISFKHDSTASNRYFAFNINNGSSYVEQLRIQDGKLIFNNDQDSYIQGSGDRFTFTTGGSEVFRIMYNRIGLNGVHPPNSHANVTSSIHLANQNTILSRTGDQYFALFQNLKYTAQDTVRYLVNGYASAYAQNAGSHRFYTVGNGTGNTNATVTERFRITNDGEILLPAAGANRISMRHYGGGTAVIKNPTAARLAFGTNNQDFEFVINNGGDVGIGSATPIERLVVQGDAFSNLTYDQDGGGFTSTSGGALVLTGYYDYSGAKLGLMVDNAGQGRIMTKTNQSLLIGTNDLKVITINGSGQTGINTTPQGQLFSIRGATDIMHYPNSSIGNNRIQIGFNGPEGYIKAKNTTGSPAANIALYTTNASGTTSKVLHCSYMGDIYAGNETGYAFFDNSTLRPRYQFRQGTGTNRGFAIIETRGDANGQDVFIAKSREGNGTGLINAGDNLGKINFAGADGTNMVNGAQIFAYTQSTATVAADRMPTNLSFRTHDDNTAGLKERIRIHHDGRVSMSKNGWAGSDATFGLTVHTGSTSETGPVGDGIMIVSQQNNGNQNSSTGKLMFCGHAQTNGPFMYGDNTNAWGKKDLVFHTTSTANSYSTQLEETARFNYQGRFGVNTGTSVNARMHLYDTGTANSNGFRFETGTSGVTAKFVIKTTDNGDESKYLRLNGHWTEVGVHNNEGFRIRNSGNSIAMYVNSGGSYRFYGSNLSDRNLKEDIETISTPTIDLIKQVSPKLFKWKNDPNKTQHGGFIAQEMQPLFPKLINGTDYDESRTDYGAPGEDQEPGNPTGLAFDYDGYTAYLTKAMQELITEVETLKAKVAALEGQ